MSDFNILNLLKEKHKKLIILVNWEYIKYVSKNFDIKKGEVQFCIFSFFINNVNKTCYLLITTTVNCFYYFLNIDNVKNDLPCSLTPPYCLDSDIIT